MFKSLTVQNITWKKKSLLREALRIVFSFVIPKISAQALPIKMYLSSGQINKLTG